MFCVSIQQGPLFSFFHPVLSLSLSLNRMECDDNDKTPKPLSVPCIPCSSSFPSSRFLPSPLPITGFQGPCAACRFLRRRCNEGCILAPYFPPNEPFRFINAHKVFGASNIVKTLQVIPTIYVHFPMYNCYILSVRIG